MAFTFVTITHTFETAADLAAAGTIDFTPIVPMHNGTTVVKKTVTASLTGSGVLSQLLAANTDPETVPTGTVYQVTERITGQSVLTYYVQVPHNAGSVLDLRDLAGWVGGTGTGGTVTAINSEGPDGTGNIVLSATDVGAQPADGDLDGLAALGDGVPRRASGTWGLVTGTPDGTKFLRDDGTWAAASGGSGYTSENARDDIAAALVAGPNVTITPNDAADTITISAASSGSSGIPASTVTTKGDLIAATGNATVARRSVGADGQALLADSVATTGVSWGAPVPADASVTNVKVSGSAAISADKLADGTANKVMTAAERTKLSGIATGATAWDTEQTQDSAATLFTTGIHSGISFSYDDANNRLNATVGTGAGGVTVVSGLTAGTPTSDTTTATANTTAIQNAINAATAATSGGHVLIPPGNYVVGQIVMKNRVWLQGAGLRGTTLIAKNSLNSDMIINFVSPDSTQQNAQHIRVSDMALDGNKANQTSGRGIVITANPTSGASTNDTQFDCHQQLEDLYIINIKGDGVVSSSRSENRILNVTVDKANGNSFRVDYDTWLINCTSSSAGLVGFYLPGTTSVRLVGCKSFWSGEVTASSGVGFNITGCQSVSMVGCEAQDNRAQGFLIENTEVFTGSGLVADSNSMNSAGTYSGFDIWNSTNCTISGVACERNAYGTSWQTHALKIAGGATGNMIMLGHEAVRTATVGTDIQSGSTTTGNWILINGTLR